MVAATNDYANQGILTKVRKVDPAGERTLGVITKPDRLSPGSGMEKAFLDLACNEDIHFRLGWHVLKNRSFEDGASSFFERNASEAACFQKSIFKTLSRDYTGIDALRNRLSQLLFAHVQQELPQLQEDLEAALGDSKRQLDTMGTRRITPQECKSYLTQLSLDYYGICKAAVNGHYEGDHFKHDTSEVFSLKSKATIRRLRAVIQYMNTAFSQDLRMRGHKYQIDRSDSPREVIAEAISNTPVNVRARLDIKSADPILHASKPSCNPSVSKIAAPVKMSNSEALKWVGQVFMRTRGRELSGSFNPLLVGELFWEQSIKWHDLATDHVERIISICSQFFAALLEEMCPKDIYPRVWTSLIQDALKTRNEASINTTAKKTR